MQRAQVLEVNSSGSGSSLPCALVGGVTGGRVPCVGVIVPPDQGCVRTWQRVSQASLGRAARP